MKSRTLINNSRRVSQSRRAGISLLEVVLSLSILAMSTAILAQIVATATSNGLMAHRLATAQILAESKMAEVVTGAIALQSGSWTPINDPVPSGTWYYRIETVTAVRKDMVGVRLSVTDDPTAMSGNPELFYIVRWMIDPTLGLDTQPQSTGATGSTGGSSSGSGSGGAVGGGIQ